MSPCNIILITVHTYTFPTNNKKKKITQIAIALKLKEYKTDDTLRKTAYNATHIYIQSPALFSHRSNDARSRITRTKKQKERREKETDCSPPVAELGSRERVVAGVVPRRRPLEAVPRAPNNLPICP